MTQLDWTRFHPFFKPQEFVCKCGCGLLNMAEDHMMMLTEARKIANIPFMISSGSRCVKHNAAVGGHSTSEHLIGKATDIVARTMRTREIVSDALKKAGFLRRGLHPLFIHAGSDHTRPWGLYLY